MTKIFRAPLLALVLFACRSPKGPAVPPPAEQHGVELSDLDRAADPCTDFFEYANGAWRKANPIPPSMQRWSRRWAVGRAQQGAAAATSSTRSRRRRRTGRRGSVEQLDRRLLRLVHGRGAHRRRSASSPLEPLLERHRRDQDARADLQARHPRSSTSSASARRSASPPRPTTTSPTQVIADVVAGGPRACPTATTTSSPSRASSRRARSTARTWRAMFKLAGYATPSAKAGGGHGVRASRRASPRPRSTTWRCAIPQTPTTRRPFAELAEDDAALRLGGVLRRTRGCRRRRPQRRASRSSSQAVDRAARADAARRTGRRI